MQAGGFGLNLPVCICSRALWTSVQLFAFESLPVTLVSVCVLWLPVSVHVQDCGPASSCPKKARVPLDTEGSEVRPSIIQGSLPHSNPVAEVHGVADAIHSCPRATQLPPHHHIHSLQRHVQLANLTSCLLSLSIPPPSSSIPLSAELNALFIPFLSLSLSLPPVSCGCVFLCVLCFVEKAQIIGEISGRFQRAIKLNNDV